MYHHCFSYVIYGDDQKYWSPLCSNAATISSLSGSLLLVYSDDPNKVHELLSSYQNYEVRQIEPQFNNIKRMARFCAAKDVKSDFYHFRDSDSCLTDLEIMIIKIQEVLGLPGTIIRNHTLHFAPILAGLFSLNREHALDLANITSTAKVSNRKYYDQVFLSREFYQKHRKRMIAFTSSYSYFGEKVMRISPQSSFAGRPVDMKPISSSELRSQNLKTLLYVRLFSRLLQSPRFVALYGRFFR